MLSPEEEKFIKYWNDNRMEYSGFKSKLLRGLPMAPVFGLPIILLIICIYFFFPDWFAKISNTSSQSFFVAGIAVLIFIIFFAFARMHFKWEMNEQLYLELKYKKKKEIAVSQSVNQ